MIEHVADDQVEAYALGALEDAERSAVDEHIAACDACLRRVGEAEETVASLALDLPRTEPSAALGERLARSLATTRQGDAPGAVVPSRGIVPLRRRRSYVWLAPLGAAAALVFALAGSFVQDAHLRGELADNDRALTQVVHSHFNHVTMTPAPGSGASAKVLFARDGSWIYVVADHLPAGTHAFATIAGSERDLGALAPQGDIATLFVSDANKPTTIILRADGNVEATATLGY